MREDGLVLRHLGGWGDADEAVHDGAGRKRVEHDGVRTVPARPCIRHEDEAATVNVSPSGATVLTGLTAGIGDSLRFECRAHKFSASVIVRNFHAGDEDRTRLNLQFIDVKFPVRQLLVPVENSAAD